MLSTCPESRPNLTQLLVRTLPQKMNFQIPSQSCSGALGIGTPYLPAPLVQPFLCTSHIRLHSIQRGPTRKAHSMCPVDTSSCLVARCGHYTLCPTNTLEQVTCYAKSLPVKGDPFWKMLMCGDVHVSHLNGPCLSRLPGALRQRLSHSLKPPATVSDWSLFQSYSNII